MPQTTSCQTSDDLPPSAVATKTLGFPRSDCLGGARPCPLVGCKHNNYLDVNPRTGHIHFNYPPHVSPEDVPPNESCSLDVADSGSKTLEEVGQILHLTRERIRQIEIQALLKLRAAIGDDGLDQMSALNQPEP